ncbi:MAG: thymidylate synthase [Mollicutes bacterium]|nr:thymidylate synthase [Mollicutes bacterium]
MLWVITNAHIYENQIEGINEQIKRYEKLGDFPAPKLILNKDIKNFFDFDTSTDLKDTQLENYRHHGPIKMKVMV